MHRFSISIPGYGGAFRRSLAVPVLEDQVHGLSRDLAAMLRPGVPLSLSLDEAIVCADRFLAIHGRPDNAPQVVTAWVNLMRWELATYWESEADWYDVRRDSTISLSHEHPKRSGELLAQGIAIRLLEKRLRLGRQRFHFLDANGARPDFLAQPSSRVQRALLLPSGQRIALEVRSRAGLTKVPKGDVGKLLAKKRLGGKKRQFKAAVSVYCAYGRPSGIRGATRTKIILADPEGDGEQVSQEEVARVVFGHYEGVAARLGMWGYRDGLSRVRLALEGGASLARVDLNPVRDPIVDGALRIPRETYFDQEYSGRFFSELIAHAQAGVLSQREAKSALDSGELGSVYFAGIRRDLLGRLRRYDHESIAAFVDERGFEEPAHGVAVNSDGTIRVEIEQATPESSLGEQVAGTLRTLLPRLR